MQDDFLALPAGVAAEVQGDARHGGRKVTPQHAGHSHAVRAPSADRLVEPRTMDDRAAAPPDAGAASPTPNADLEVILEPMLAAIVTFAGASAGAVNVIGADGAHFEPVVASGLPAGAGGGAVWLWCNACAESRRADSACVKSDLCGHEQRFPADVLGPVCKHIVAVPLRHKNRPVGMLNLMFEVECALAPEMTPLLKATGDLLGMTLDNARLARENLRIRLTNERHMMANEVHDSLAQGLTYMRMRMSLLRDAIRQNDELRAHKFWSDVDDTLGNSQRRLRELITCFRTRMDPQGLLHALSEISAGFFDRTGIALEFTNRLPALYLAPEREIEVLHIVQESLANVCRHANAGSARLLLERKGDNYEFVVEDDGVGIAAYADGSNQDGAGHYGIAIMRERARRLGGDLLLGVAAGSGTRVALTFPVAETESVAAS
jgi:two-component system nitrate/nitrite sensor histidine kinase NarX